MEEGLTSFLNAPYRYQEKGKKEEGLTAPIDI